MDKYPLHRTGATGYNGTGKTTRYERSTVYPLPRSKGKEGEGEMRGVLKRAIETYGAEAQLNVAIEEFAELTKEICKHKRYMDNTKAIIEEMADCYIMLEQMQMIFGLGSTVINDAMNKKIKRLKRRLDTITPQNDEVME